MAWVLNALYLLAGLLALPWLMYRRWRQGKRFGSWREKLGGDLRRHSPDAPCLWLHAVSVGEVLQLRTVLKELEPVLRGWEFVITTTTVTAQEVARKQFPQHTIAYFPLDFSWSVSRALKQLRPQAVVLVELEVWPNFLRAAERLEIPVIIINGRMSDRSFPMYRRTRWLWQRVLPRVTAAAVQNQVYADRLVHIGLPRERIQVTGSIKFDHVETRRDNPRTLAIRQALGFSATDRVFVAGSTQAPEEEYALATYRTLRAEFPNLRLLLVPRHKERFEEVAELVERSGFPLLRRTQTQNSEGHASGADLPPVVLLDTLGELSAAWGVAEVAFVGGSLMRRGGQNMIEPAGYGAAVLFGPHTANFRDIVAQLLSADAALVVQDAQDLTATVGRLLREPAAARALGDRAQTLVLQQAGATVSTVELLLEVLFERNPAMPAAAAGDATESRRAA